jgi:hypothetical protein
MAAIASAIVTTFSVPSRKMERRQEYTTLGDIFEKDENDVPLHFNGKMRRHDGLKYRIPEHQRHPSWKKEAKQLLVDTVFRNYPMSGFVVSEHCKDSQIWFDFEDGQSRMSILQDFYQDGFAFETEDGHQVKFSQLSHSVRRKFENYKINIEVMYNYEENAQFEVFERLQFGEPLKDKDLYWNRRDYTYVQKAMQLISTPSWKGLYMNTSKGISDTERTPLPSVVTFIYAIIQYNNIKQREGIVSKRRSMWKCFRAQAPVLNDPITDSENEKIDSFLEYLNHIIDEVYRIYPRQPRERVGTWCNFAKQTGMILLEWLESENDEDINAENQEKWIDMIVLERKSSDFMFKKGKKTMWNGLHSTAKQNTDDAAIYARLERLNEFYLDRETIAAENGIVYWTEDSDNAEIESSEGDE